MERTGTTSARKRERFTSPRSFVLWFGVLGPPLAWGAHVLLGDALFELGCAPGASGTEAFGVALETWSLLQTAVLAGITALAGVGAARALASLGRTGDGSTGPVERARAMAWAGVASAVIYGAIIVFGFFAPFVLENCAPSI